LSPRNDDQTIPQKDGLRTNHQIRSPRVLVIADDGRRLGEFLTRDALQMAQEQGWDLIEVSPNTVPPVCKLGDYGKLRYEQRKTAKKQVQVLTKEINVRPKTDEHDLDVKLRAARKFLEGGDKVKVTVKFRGREHAHREIGEDQCRRFTEALKDVGKVMQPPRMDGKAMTMLIDPMVSKQALQSTP